MKRRSTTVSLLAAATAACILGSVAAAPSSKPPVKPAPKGTAKPPAVSKFRQHQLDMLRVSAPGDEYFGRLKMSYLGIDNTFRDESIRAGAYTTDSHIISQVDFAEEALRDWANRYPKDPQLARSYFLAYTMYLKIYTLPGQTKAWQYLHIIEQRFPSSYFGKLIKKDLVGFTEHYFMVPQPCPSEAPTESPSPGGGRRRAAPTPSPTPSPTPVPTITPSPAPGQPNVDILPVPCYTPIPPTPSPTPVPTLGPSALPSALPTTHGSPLPLPIATPTPLPTRH